MQTKDLSQTEKNNKYPDIPSHYNPLGKAVTYNCKELNEISINQKKENVIDVENAFQNGKKRYLAIKIITVFTGETPNIQQMQSSFHQKHKKASYSLKEALGDSQYTIIPAKGSFLGTKENSFAVINIAQNTAAFFSGRYQQTSFIYSIFHNDGTVHSEYWEKKDATQPYNKDLNPYVIKDASDTRLDMEEDNDCYTIVGNLFKYQIQSSIFTETNQRIINNISRFLIHEGKIVSEENIDSEIRFGYERVGYPAYRRRFAANVK